MIKSTILSVYIYITPTLEYQQKKTQKTLILKIQTINGWMGWYAVTIQLFILNTQIRSYEKKC